ncbi:MAG: P-loop NTPase [Clostridia bacterium]|nr:P-loop NTPase [Clostridia bacterium]
MTRTVLVTSCKGGVGKSTVAANLTMALSTLGKKCILIDMDLGNRSLDLMLGCEDRVVYDISDVCSGRVEIERALITFDSPRSFSLCPAPFMYSDEDITPESLRAVLDRMKEQYAPDFIILDTSGGADISVELCARVSDQALIVSSRNPSSIRAAGKSAMLLDSYGVGEQKLIINSMELTKESTEGRVGVLEMIDMTGISLIGIIPKEWRIERLCEKGKLALESKYAISKRAFLNTARRITGERVPLLDKIKGLRERQRRRILCGSLHK